MKIYEILKIPRNDYDGVENSLKRKNFNCSFVCLSRPEFPKEEKIFIEKGENKLKFTKGNY